MTRENSGSMRRNERKENANQPDFRGSCRIEGHDYWISGWVKEYDGQKFFSLAFKMKDGTQERPESPTPVRSEPARILDDEVPF